MITMIQIQEAFSGSTYLGNGFFRKGKREVHAFWHSNKWSFVGYVRDVQIGALSSLDMATLFLGV